MKITYYYEFFVESLKNFINIKNNGKIILPYQIANHYMYFDSFYSQERYRITIDHLLNLLEIPYEFTELDTITSSEIIHNFQQYFIYDNSLSFNEPKKFSSIDKKMKDIYSPFVGEYHEIDGIGYLVSKKSNNKPYIILFNAYNVGFNIWKPLYNLLKENYQVLLFEGNYGDISKSSDIIYRIIQKEGFNDFVVLTWCSGFQVFANFYKCYPQYIIKVISLTGNYNNINGKGQLSNFEQSLLSIQKLIDINHPYQLEKIFSYIFLNQKKKLFGIPEDVYPLISKQFSDNKNLYAYLTIAKELYENNLELLHNQISIPMVNIIASNDFISTFENNQLINSIVDNCQHIMLSFATHWCLWTHATQIVTLIDREMEVRCERK